MCSCWFIFKYPFSLAFGVSRPFNCISHLGHLYLSLDLCRFVDARWCQKLLLIFRVFDTSELPHWSRCWISFPLYFILAFQWFPGTWDSVVKSSDCSSRNTLVYSQQPQYLKSVCFDIPVPRDLMSFGLHRCCTHVVHRHTHSYKTTYIWNRNN